MTQQETPEVNVGGCIVKLDDAAAELGRLAGYLADVERKLEPLQEVYEQGFGDFEAGMFERYEKGEGKWPGEETRERLYRRTLPPEARQQIDQLVASRKRIEKRLSSLKAEVDAQRSILSALKVEMEATR
jgi:hypothetical protein